MEFSLKMYYVTAKLLLANLIALMSNTPELNRTDCRHRRPDSAEVRSRNLLRLTGSRILAGVWEEERPWERGGPEVS